MRIRAINVKYGGAAHDNFLCSFSNERKMLEENKLATYRNTNMATKRKIQFISKSAI